MFSFVILSGAYLADMSVGAEREVAMEKITPDESILVDKVLLEKIPEFAVALENPGKTVLIRPETRRVSRGFFADILEDVATIGMAYHSNDPVPSIQVINGPSPQKWEVGHNFSSYWMVAVAFMVAAVFFRKSMPYGTTALVFLAALVTLKLVYLSIPEPESWGDVGAVVSAAIAVVAAAAVGILGRNTPQVTEFGCAAYGTCMTCSLVLFMLG
ncbi:hypothetical protein A3C87_00540 [Candidatus Kaiserbacteria bacterium RIFCSPHIGHO2_02_FULL_49_34]|uniref:Uncharacterized protein n=1 Tax=Candidatus Kaiserbacteria bacterium RIFCSPHIGHO2_02_FULL_49_34 TaxID=1798491 RepID=A0A1F6DLJ2_9BACT|nr:MAG: hypothetical protein A3C87_00540 [Candidatus Kaiserbacteria bacterium RIFCSPHIGHO2_02_FULL_49_34]